MPKAVGLMLTVKKSAEETKVPIRLSFTAEEKDLFAKYLQLSGGTPSEIVNLAVKRILRTDKFFNGKKDSITVGPNVWSMIQGKKKKK